MKAEKIFNKIPTNDYFEKWYQDTYCEDNFAENVGFYSHLEDELLEEVKEEFSSDNNIDLDTLDENSKEFRNFFEAKKEEKIKEYAEDWYENRLSDFLYSLEEIGEFTDCGIVCTRAITVDDKEEFLFLLINNVFMKDYNGIGVYWSWDHGKAEAHWSSGTHKISLKALIPYSAINQESTFLLNMNPSLGMEEAEIRIYDEEEIEVVSVDDVIFDTPLKIKA